MEYDLLRIIFAFICGYALSLSGTLTQVVTSNSLASPSTLGFDGLVVLIVLISHFLVTFFVDLDLAIISFGIFACCLLVLGLTGKIFSRRNKKLSMGQVILIGLGFNLLVGAVFSIVQFLFMAVNMQFPSGLWFGNFRSIDPQAIWILLPSFLIACLGVWRLAGPLTLINIDQTLAKSAGVNVSSIQKKSLLLSLLLTGSVICFFGVFSFLGLIFPHLMRSIKWFREDVKSELMWSPLLSGVLLSMLDLGCYNLTLYGAELPVGMVSSVIGSFLLIMIVIKKVVIQ